MLRKIFVSGLKRNKRCRRRVLGLMRLSTDRLMLLTLKEHYVQLEIEKAKIYEYLTFLDKEEMK